MSSTPPRRLLAITDRTRMGADPLAAAEKLIASLGPSLVLQIRERDLPAKVLLAWLERLLPVARLHGAQLMLNDRADVVRSLASDLTHEIGVQLPEAGLNVGDARALLGPDVMIGRSVHDAVAAAEALAAGADLVTLAPIFASPGKGTPLGLDEIRRALIQVPAHTLFALGGIDARRAPEVWATGVGGLAAIRAVWSEDPAALLAATHRTDG